MTTRIERTVTESMAYIAQDGKRFGSETACEAYEAELMYDKKVRDCEQMPHFEYYPRCCDEDGEMIWSWYYVRNCSDLDSVKEALFNGDSTAQDYEPEAYPCWLSCIHDRNGYGEIRGTLTDVRNDILKDIARIIEKQREAFVEKYGEPAKSDKIV